MLKEINKELSEVAGTQVEYRVKEMDEIHVDLSMDPSYLTNLQV